MFDLNGKVALITGSSRGIGRAIAEAMAGQGAKVIVSSRTVDACEAVVAAISDEGGDALAIPCNINHKDELDALVGLSLKACGRIDILVCNAAVNPYLGPLGEITDDAYDRTMDTNVKHTLWLCNKVLPQMAARRSGSVIIVSSIAGLKGTSRLGAYALSKATGNTARSKPCGRMGGSEYSRQLPCPRSHPNRFLAGALGRPGLLCGSGFVISPAAHRRTKGRGRCRGLPRL